MKNFFNFLSVIAVIVMVITILLQSRGSGLGSAFGGEGNFYASRRGAEKIIFNTTIISAVIYVASIILGLLSKR